MRNHSEKHLVSKGIKVLKKNWRFGHKEIDIIAENDDYLIIVEVHPEAASFFEDASSVITNKKKRFFTDCEHKNL